MHWWSSKYPRVFSWLDDNKNLKYRRGDIIKYKNNYGEFFGIVLNRYKYTKYTKDFYGKDISDYGVEFMMINGPKVTKSYMVLCNSDITKTEHNFKDLLDEKEFYHDNCKRCKKSKCSEKCYIPIQDKKEYIINHLNINLYKLERNDI